MRLDDTTKTNMLLRQIHAANQDEIEMGKLAADKAQSPEVKRFASQMVTDHTQADQSSPIWPSDRTSISMPRRWIPSRWRSSRHPTITSG